MTRLLKKVWVAITKWLKECEEIGTESTYSDVDSHLNSPGQGLPENQRKN